MLVHTAAVFVLLALIGEGAAKWGDNSCGKLKKVGLHPPHRRAVVNWHNEWRAKIVAGNWSKKQPPAVYMRPMEYDMELEESAQNLASKCRYVRGGNLNVSRKFGDVGQNVFTRRWPWSEGHTDRTTSWAMPVRGWYDEIYKFDPQNIAPFKFTEKARDYTQLAWAESYAVGCGFTNFQPWDDDHYHSLYICHYGPKGNVEGAVMYEVKPSPSTEPPSVDNGV